MSREITETFTGRSTPKVMVGVDGVEVGGEVRARAVDHDPFSSQEPQLWALVQWIGPHGRPLLRWFPTSHLRPAPGTMGSDVPPAGAVVPTLNRHY